MVDNIIHVLFGSLILLVELMTITV